MEKAEDTIKRMLSQLPECISEEDVVKALEKYDTEMAALEALMGVEPCEPKVSPENSVQQKWSEIREICDAHDDAMQELIRKST